MAVEFQILKKRKKKKGCIQAVKDTPLYLQHSNACADIDFDPTYLGHNTDMYNFSLYMNEVQ